MGIGFQSSELISKKRDALLFINHLCLHDAYHQLVLLHNADLLLQQPQLVAVFLPLFFELRGVSFALETVGGSHKGKTFVVVGQFLPSRLLCHRQHFDIFFVLLAVAQHNAFDGWLHFGP
jgi:hypothetical protein